MQQTIFASLLADLQSAVARGGKRQRRIVSGAQQPMMVVNGQPVVSFAGNDYLGLANHQDLIAAAKAALDEVGVGGAASHLICGHNQLHEALEIQLAAFVQQPKALLFSTGYMANLGVITALMGRHDDVFADRLNHASLNDAVVLSRANFKRYPHNDMAGLERQLSQSRAARKLVVVDAVFSMDGDLAPLPKILALCERHDAWLMVDDAHGFGVLGDHGQGTLAHFGVSSPRIITMATLGKAFGVFGAFVAGDSILIDYLTQRARSYIYTTAAPPMLAAAVLAALGCVVRDDWRRGQLHRLRRDLTTQLMLKHWKLLKSETPIQPLCVWDNHTALKLADYLLQRGFFVPAIRPPTVPEGSARLRISLSAAHTREQLAQLIGCLHEAEREFAG